MKVQANGLAIEIEDSGGEGRPAVLLLMGLGMQLVAWPDTVTGPLLAAGFRVVRMDNRDVGLSQHLDHLGVPNLLLEAVKHRFGMAVRAPYGVHDMAQDALGVLDAVGIRQAHVVGASMGGMVAQRIALAAPQRVLSLTSIMSSSGAAYLPGPRMPVLKALLARPANRSEAAIVEHYMQLFRLIGSPGYPMDEADMRQRVTLSVRRSFHPAGTARQLAAVAADTRRADELPRIRRPTLVVHGTDDPLVPFACGQDTARRITGARLLPVPGMGHDLPPGAVAQYITPLVEHLLAAA